MRQSTSKLSVGEALTSEETIKRALDGFRDALHERGLRYSGVREAIARVALSYDGHFEVNDLMRVLRAQGVKDAHLATVYRTLPLLVETGLIQPALLSSGERHFYEPAFERPHHDHLICTSCDKVVEFEFEAFEILQHDIAARYGFQLTAHFHELLGLCADCRASGPAGQTPTPQGKTNS
jgi:Fur family transcriptional regulator, ferric uptake regulator